VLQFLVANVCSDTWQLANAHRSEVIALLPAEASTGSVAVPIREPCAGAFETLDQPRRVVDGRELEEEMYVVTHYADLNDSSAMPFSFGE
jgi:hypothetical protein